MANKKKDFEKIINAINVGNDFSGVISIRLNGEIVYEKAFGYAERVNKRLNDVNTKFAIASGTKFLTALAIGRLVDQGKVGLDSHAFDYIDYDFPSYNKFITIRDLLTHTSGIPDYFDEDKIEDIDNFTVEKSWSLMFKPQDYFGIFPQDPMKNDPGEIFEYNNSGYIILAAIVAKISGIPYIDFVKKEIFDLCGMENSGFYPLDELPANTAIGYIETKGGYRTNILNLPMVGGGDGGAFTTVEDCYKLWDCFFSDVIISKQLVEIYTKPYSKVNDDIEDDTYYGHGIWMNCDKRSTCHLFIEGCDSGISFRSGYISERDMVYTIMSNTSDGVWSLIKPIISE